MRRSPEDQDYEPDYTDPPEQFFCPICRAGFSYDWDLYDHQGEANH